MAHPIPQYMGVTSFPIQAGNDVWEKLGKHQLVYCSTILCLIFNFANDLLTVYSRTRIKEPHLLRTSTLKVHVPNFGGLSGLEDRGGGDNSIQFINFGRVGDKSFEE